jgi:hypothetical protein
MIMNKNYKRILNKVWSFNLSIFFLLPLMIFTGCKKLVEAPPPTDQVSEKNVFSTDATAIGVLTDIYASMNAFDGPFLGYKSTSIYTGLSSDELTLYSGALGGTLERYYYNDLSGTLLSGHELWAPMYNFIYRCNAAIKGLDASTSLTPAVKNQLLGEARFMRAFYYFYLTNLYGDVPLALTIDADVNSSLNRTPKADVYQQIISDLKDAAERLNSNFLNITLSGSTTERVRPTKWAAKALLARAYLYTNKNAEAEAMTTEVINNTSLFTLLTNLNQVFLKNSKEAIWQLQPTLEGFNTMEAYVMMVPPWGPDAYTNTVYLSDQLLNSFEVGDLRAVPGNWIDAVVVGSDTYKYANKYKQNQYDPNIAGTAATFYMTEYFMVLRLAEQYLIRAEARAQQNNLSGAIADLDKIRQRAGLPLIANTNPGINQSALLNAILHERQVELFTELGQRWFDLKRTGKVNAVMTLVTPQKTNNTIQWRPYQQLYPVSYLELQKAPNLGQTPGY